MQKLFCGLVLFVTLLANAWTQDGSGNKADPVKIGAYYYGGWWRGGHAVRERLTTEFANREPVWGWYAETPEVMKKEIDAAADGGLSFWAFCWYYPEGENKAYRNNDVIDLYLKSPNKDRLQYCLLMANHKGSRIGPKDWDAVTSKWIEYFKEPTYLKVSGKPVVIIFSPGELLKAFGNPEAIKVAFDKLKTDAIKAGLSGVTIAACATPGPENNWSNLDQLRACGYDFFTAYNYSLNMPKIDRNQPLQKLVEWHEKIWNLFAQKNVLPYVPVVTTGWDMRPWEKLDLPVEKQSVYYSDRSPEQVEQFIRKGIQWVNEHPQNTLPEKLLLLYAWNELGEGGYLTPSKAEGDAYLKTIKKAMDAK